MGCLTRDIVDDGRGSARSHCFQHVHEKETGRTSAISVQVMGMDAAGATLRTAETSRVRHFQAVRAQSKRIITFVDLAGHEKYLKSACAARWPGGARKRGGPSHALVPAATTPPRPFYPPPCARAQPPSLASLASCPTTAW